MPSDYTLCQRHGRMMCQECRRDNRSGRQRYHAAMDTAVKDIQWLVEKSHSAVFNGDPRRREEIETRRARLEGTIDLARTAHDMLFENVVRLGKDVTVMQTDVRTAITGLRDFLNAIQNMPMGEETRTTIREQVVAIDASLDAAQSSGSEGEPGGRPGA